MPTFSCNGTYRDAFGNDQSFAGSKGSIDWSGAPWIEVGESDGPGAGDVRVTNDISDFQVRLRDNDNGGEGIERTVDLTDATAASLSYEYRRQGLDSADDYVAVQVRASMSDPWTELTRHTGSATDGAYQTATHDISDHIAPTTQIRLAPTALTSYSREESGSSFCSQVAPPSLVLKTPRSGLAFHR